MLPGKRWKILNNNSNTSIIDVLLKNRNLPPEHMEPFRLTERLHSPYLLPDMEKAVQRILSAIEKQEKIVVFGDYDADGVTSTALMLYFFRRIHFPVKYILPHRERDGYGLSEKGVDQVAAMGGKLIITVDNGISSNLAIAYAATLGIDVVVTDHHLQEGELPPAAAVVNPNRSDSTYPFKDICGAAVAYKLIHALSEKLLPEADYKQFMINSLDLVAIGTIADVMPLRDENYALVKFGLKVLSNTRKPGLVELKRVSGVKEKKVTPISVGFFLSPRINAAGRLGRADKALELIMADSIEQAGPVAAELDKVNRERQKLQTEYLKFALQELEQEAKKMGKIIFVENESWQPGLIGLVSGQLKELYSRPVIAFARDEQGNYVGSARSIEAFHITKALTEFKEYFQNYGGHHKAAGLTLSKENYASFRDAFIAYANEHIAEDDLVPELIIDAVADIEQTNLTTAHYIQEVGPFGESNPEPVFVMKTVRIRDMFTMTDGKHLKFTVEKGNQLFECVWWRGGKYKDSLQFGETIDLAFRMEANSWQGKERLQLVVEDVAKVD